MNPLFILVAPFLLGGKLTVTSPAFEHNQNIPSKYTCEGANVSPELNIQDIPEKTQTLALIMDDPDAPNGTVDHWIMWNIPADGKIAENSAPGMQGKNVKKENKYTGPCPPTGTHRYYFKVYALDTKLDLKETADKKELEKAMKGHVIAKGELIGKYKKTSEITGTK